MLPGGRTCDCSWPFSCTHLLECAAGLAEGRTARVRLPLVVCLLPLLGQEPPCILETQALGRCRHDLSPEPEPGRLSPGRAFIPSRLLTPGASKRNPDPSCRGPQSRLSSTISPHSPCPDSAHSSQTDPFQFPTAFRTKWSPLSSLQTLSKPPSSTMTLTCFPVTQ